MKMALICMILVIAGLVQAAPTNITMLVTSNEQAMILHRRIPAKERMAEMKAKMEARKAETLAKMTPEQLKAYNDEQAKLAAMTMDQRRLDMLLKQKAQIEVELAKPEMVEAAKPIKGVEVKPVDVPVVEIKPFSILRKLRLRK